MNHVNWSALIGQHVLVQQRISELDSEGLWGHELPQLPSAPEEVASLESRVGPLPADYRGFLHAANGWRAFHQWVDLFSVADLTGSRGEEARRACEEFSARGVFAPAGVLPADLLPVGSTRPGYRELGVTLFLIAVRGRTRGTVYWLGSRDLVDSFPSFTRFVASMTEYGLQEVEALQRERAQRKR